MVSTDSLLQAAINSITQHLATSEAYRLAFRNPDRRTELRPRLNQTQRAAQLHISRLTQHLQRLQKHRDAHHQHNTDPDTTTPPPPPPPEQTHAETLATAWRHYEKALWLLRVEYHPENRKDLQEKEKTLRKTLTLNQQQQQS